MSSIYFSQVQHPVGQGGFHTGRLFKPVFPLWLFPSFQSPTLFAWAYDCGSNDLSTLAEQIKTVRGASFNVLFLSHLDGDHVVGVDEFISSVSSVNEVVLPYLGDDDWALHLASSASSGKLSGNFIDLAADPAGWFGRRGVRRINYVEAGNEEDEFPGAPDPLGPEDDPSGERSPKIFEGETKPFEPSWSRPPRVVAEGNVADGRAEIVRLERSSILELSAASRLLNWVLSPFAFQPPPGKLRDFRKMLDRKFGPGLSAKDYADRARTEAGRNDLRECYDAVWTSHNLHSMALYAGPSVLTTDPIRNTAWHSGFNRRMVPPGWVSTGDFDASVARRCNALVRYYARYAPMVGELALPHHGSDASFDPAILAAFPALRFAIAAVGPNGYGHPGRGVQAAVASASVNFVRVDDGPSSIFQVGGPVEEC